MWESIPIIKFVVHLIAHVVFSSGSGFSGKNVSFYWKVGYFIMKSSKEPLLLKCF